MADWSDWVQGVAGNVINKVTDSQYVQPYEIQKLQLEALGQAGYYTEGRPGVQQPQAGALNISPTVLLLGGAAVLVLVLVRD